LQQGLGLKFLDVSVLEVDVSLVWLCLDLIWSNLQFARAKYQTCAVIVETSLTASSTRSGADTADFQ
jgi:hypothetical protein